MVEVSHAGWRGKFTEATKLAAADQKNKNMKRLISSPVRDTSRKADAKADANSTSSAAAAKTEVSRLRVQQEIEKAKLSVAAAGEASDTSAMSVAELSLGAAEADMVQASVVGCCWWRLIG